MIKAKAILATSLIAASFLASTGAYAKDYTIGVIPLTGFSTSNTVDKAGTFEDKLTFTIASQSLTEVLWGTFKTTSNFSSSSVSLFDISGSKLGDIPFGFDPAHPELTNTFKLTSGDYYLLVSGTTKVPNAKYNYDIEITPVPEAETYSMMLAGLGLMGFVAARRKV